MGSATLSREQLGRRLCTTLRLIRRERGMSSSAVAAQMEMPLRTYQTFEAGKSGVDLGRVLRFAYATDSDAVSILAAVVFDMPDLALRCLGNKAAAIIWACFRALNEKVGDRLMTVESASVIAAVKKGMDELERSVRRRDEDTERWLEQNIAKMFTNDPDP